MACIITSLPGHTAISGLPLSPLSHCPSFQHHTCAARPERWDRPQAWGVTAGVVGPCAVDEPSASLDDNARLSPRQDFLVDLASVRNPIPTVLCTLPRKDDEPELINTGTVL